MSTSTTWIQDVPEEMVNTFKEAFPQEQELIDAVRRGDCDVVGDLLTSLGGETEGPDDYPKFSALQNDAAGSWWSYFNDVFFSK